MSFPHVPPKIYQVGPGVNHADIRSNLALISECGYKVAGHFTLPESAWWNHYYAPLEKRLAELRSVYASNPEAQDILAYHQNEIDIYRQYSAYYGYEFFVCQFQLRGN